MKSLTRREAAAFLAQNEHYTILSHRRPDGDTLGSCALLCRSLRQLGKTAHILENPEVTPKYAHLLTGLTKSAPETGDVLVSVDVAADNMLPANYAGETIALGLTLRNRWGMSENTQVTIDTLENGISDPYVEILNDTVNFCFHIFC